MAKNNNLTDYLTDLRSAIQSAEGGGTAKINPQDFADRIRALSAIETIDIPIQSGDTWKYNPNGKLGWLVFPYVDSQDDGSDFEPSILDQNGAVIATGRQVGITRDSPTLIACEFTTSRTTCTIAGSTGSDYAFANKGNCILSLKQTSESSGAIRMKGWFIPRLFS